MNSPRGVVQHFLRASFLPRGWLFSLTRSLWGTTLDCFGPFLMSDICDRTTRNGLFCLLQFVVDYVCIWDHAIENLDLRPGLEVLNSTKQPPGRSWFAAVCVFMCTVCVSFPSRCVAKINSSLINWEQWARRRPNKLLAGPHCWFLRPKLTVSKCHFQQFDGRVVKGSACPSFAALSNLIGILSIKLSLSLLFPFDS